MLRRNFMALNVLEKIKTKINDLSTNTRLQNVQYLNQKIQCTKRNKRAEVNENMQERWSSNHLQHICVFVISSDYTDKPHSHCDWISKYTIRSSYNFNYSFSGVKELSA